MAFREIRCVLREYSYDGNRLGGLDGQIEAAKQQADFALATVTRWCQVHFGEVYSGWVHLKVIRAFVESVLRYGLPVNFLAVFLEPNVAREKAIGAALTSAVTNARPELAVQKGLDGDEDEEEETDHLPYVCHKFNVIGSGFSS